MKLWRIALLSFLACPLWAQQINLGPPAVRGTLQATNCPVLTGDVTASANTCVTTLTVHTLTINTSSPLGGGGSVALGGTLTITCTTCSTTNGTVTSIATTSPITGGTITTTGTIACATCVVASSPGVGLAHFAGSTQTVTSSAVNLASADVTGVLPAANSTYQVLSAQFSNTDSVNCPNNTTGNFATTYTIPANYLTANKLLRVILGLALTTSASPPTIAYRMTVGGTNVYVAAGAVPTASLSGIAIGITFVIQGSAAAGASVAVYTHPLNGYMGLSSSVNGIFQETTALTIVQPVNLATNGTLVIQPQLFCSANTAGNSMKVQQMVVEALN